MQSRLHSALAVSYSHGVHVSSDRNGLQANQLEIVHGIDADATGAAGAAATGVLRGGAMWQACGRRRQAIWTDATIGEVRRVRRSTACVGWQRACTLTCRAA